MSTPGTPVAPVRAASTDRSNRTFWTVAGVVVCLHAAAIAAIMLSRLAEPETVTPPRIVTATLISPEPAPVPVPVAAPAPPQPEPPKPVVHKTPPKERRPTPHPTPKPSPIPAVETPTPPQPTAPPTVAASPPAPAPAPAPAVDPNIPKNVRHLTCEGTPPVYPALSRRRGETGTVVIQFIVGLRGNVESATVKKSSGFDRLDDAARAAALASPCTPYMENGQAVRAITERPYNFSLSD